MKATDFVEVNPKKMNGTPTASAFVLLLFAEDSWLSELRKGISGGCRFGWK